MNVIYFDLYQSKRLEQFVDGTNPKSVLRKGRVGKGGKSHFVLFWKFQGFRALMFQNCVKSSAPLPFLFPAAYGAFLRSVGEDGVRWRRASSAEDVLKEAHVVRRGVSQERGVMK